MQITMHHDAAKAPQPFHTFCDANTLDLDIVEELAPVKRYLVKFTVEVVVDMGIGGGMAPARGMGKTPLDAIAALADLLGGRRAVIQPKAAPPTRRIVVAPITLSIDETVINALVAQAG